MIIKVSAGQMLMEYLRPGEHPDGKSYPTKDEFCVKGLLVNADVTNYESSRGTSWGDLIGRFSVRGVLRDEDHVLAFDYQATDVIPKVTGEQHLVEQGKITMEEVIQGNRQRSTAEYLHLRSLLNPGAIIHLEGKVRNNNPRLFLPHGMALDVGDLVSKHGLINIENKPIYR
jgi:hypothetical protein